MIEIQELNVKLRKRKRHLCNVFVLVVVTVVIIGAILGYCMLRGDGSEDGLDMVKRTGEVRSTAIAPEVQIAHQTA